MKGSVRFGIATVTLAWISGCTTVHLHGVDSVQRSSWFGALSITPRPASWHAVSIKGVGLVPGTSGVTLGYRNEQFVTSPPDDCRVVFFIESEADAKAAADVIKELHERDQRICTLNSEGKP